MKKYNLALEEDARPSSEKIESNKLETLEWSKEDDEPSCDNINGQSNQEINDGEIESDHGSDEETATIEVNAAITRSKALLNKDIRNSELGKPQKEKKNKEAMRKLLNAERQKLALPETNQSKTPN